MIDAILGWVVFAGFCVAIASTLRKGEFRKGLYGSGTVLKRAESPGEYWFWTCVFVAATFIAFLLAVHFTFAR